ncbi:SGNH hydrolase domain-containing protein [Luedemannella flava]|uniref:SGNH hydrolase domain-containing protein n=1 Tax=Luedemannella flava TaxID=349316 RepID=A0ABP4Y797_9ACTN
MVTIAAPRPVTSHRVAPGFRPDIEGLRAVAVLLVVLHHAGVPMLDGGYVGVDVFFVISGYLITTLLSQELHGTGRIRLSRFYARRATRLLPAAVLVIVVTVAASWLLMPTTRLRGLAGDAITSALYTVNYRTAAAGIDYFQSTSPPSPLQHFWSLAVEEQFYLVWPVLLLLCARRRRAVFWVLAAVAVGSLALSVWQTDRAAPWAYFGAHTRAWELAAGALLALTALRLPAVASWVGLGAILTAAVTFDAGTAFPGYAAALPVAGAALIIAAGPGRGAARLLDARPCQVIGRLSYGWYLWHWPVLLIVPVALRLPGSVALGLALSVLALGLAAVTHRLVENPVRFRPSLRARPGRALVVGAALSCCAAGIGLTARTLPPPLPVGPPAPDTRALLAASPTPDATITDLLAASTGTARVPANLVPGLFTVSTLRPTSYRDGCHNDFADVVVDVARCTYGDRAGRTTVVLVGDSHAAQWLPALEPIAAERGWRLVALTKAACKVPAVAIFSNVLRRPYGECDVWRERAFTAIADLRPALVVMASSEKDRPVRVTGDVDRTWVDGWVRSAHRLAATGSRPVLLNDTVWPRGNAPDCLTTPGRDIPACQPTRDEAIMAPDRRRLLATTMRAAGVAVIDPAPWLCTATLCPPVVGNVLVHADASHLTTTYAAALAHVLGPRLDAALARD